MGHPKQTWTRVRPELNSMLVTQFVCFAVFMYGERSEPARERASEWRSREVRKKGELAKISYKFSFLLRPGLRMCVY